MVHSITMSKALTLSISWQCFNASPYLPDRWWAKAHSSWNHIHCISCRLSIAGTPSCNRAKHLMVVFLTCKIVFDVLYITSSSMVGLYERFSFDNTHRSYNPLLWVIIDVTKIDATHVSRSSISIMKRLVVTGFLRHVNTEGSLCASNE